jgi:serine/threonine protein kinase
VQAAAKAKFALRRPRGHPHLPRAAILSILKQLLLALCHIHSQGLVHMDVKTENLMVFSLTGDAKSTAITGSDFTGALRLTDFGLSKHIGEAVPKGCGTPSHLPPELATEGGAPASPAMDIWSCGIMAYELIQVRSYAPALMYILD